MAKVTYIPKKKFYCAPFHNPILYAVVYSINARPPSLSLALSTRMMTYLGTSSLTCGFNLISCTSATLMLLFSMKCVTFNILPLSPLQFRCKRLKLGGLCTGWYSFGFLLSFVGGQNWSLHKCDVVLALRTFVQTEQCQILCCGTCVRLYTSPE